MNLQLISFPATDKVLLPGVLYQPERSTKRVAVWLHGMGDTGVFYNPDRINAVGGALAKQGIALLAFNNRGAHNRKSLKIIDSSLPEEDRRYLGGTHYELITDCVKDIGGAVDFLEQRDFSEFYLLGHSTGANKICAYHARQPKNKFSKYVLAGPGDDVGLFFKDLGSIRFWQGLKYAAGKLESDPLHIMPKYTGMYPFSVQAAWDILNPDGAYNTFPYYECRTERLGGKPPFEEYREIDKKTLVIIGKEDEYMYTAGSTDAALNLFMRHTSNAQLKQTDFISLPEADHGFHGQEVEFAKTVADWLAHG